MSISLSKGANISLTKQAPGLTSLALGLGWDVRTTDGEDFDLDAVALVVGADGRLLSDKHLVFYGNLSTPDGAVKHLGDNLTGAGQGDDEQVLIDLAALGEGADKVMLAVSVYQGDQRAQAFGQVRSAFIRAVDTTSGAELARFDLSEDAATEIVMIFAEVYRHGAEWKMRAVGQGYAGGLDALVRDHGGNT